MSNFGRGNMSSKTKHFLFSTFMYVEKHANYMQINYFPLVKEKKQEVNKGKRKLKYFLRLLLRFSKRRRVAL